MDEAQKFREYVSNDVPFHFFNGAVWFPLLNYQLQFYVKVIIPTNEIILHNGRALNNLRIRKLINISYL